MFRRPSRYIYCIGLFTIYILILKFIGTGKTSISSSIARALNRKVKICPNILCRGISKINRAFKLAGHNLGLYYINP